MDLYWQNKIVLITGGSSGLGKVLARHFLENSAQVILVARHEKGLSDAVDELQAISSKVSLLAADVTSTESVEELYDQVSKKYSRLDLLLNVAGRSTRGNALEVPVEEFQEIWDLNFLSIVRTTQTFAPLLKDSQGTIVNIGSLASKGVSPFLGAYPVSKFSVAAYSAQIRQELQPFGVHVLLVCPGPIHRSDSNSRYLKEAKGLPGDAGKPGGGIQIAGLDADRLADKILLYAKKKRAELIMPAKAKILFVLSQISPRLGDWIIKIVGPKK
ncbi:MAG: SDR family NAD(P)-dependent oxidoreductase [Pirellulaceae bacterium]|nr:SDR family NAD(P)-dependent oxidoreductase [Pirellulaceae bacterium]